MPKKLIIGNWKMNPQSLKEAELLFKSISIEVKDVKNTDIVICAPFVFLSALKKLKIKKISLGAQDVFYEQKGAYTGEVSALMLRNANVEYVIVGHSERRSFGETNEVINKKLVAVLKAKMTPVLCIGEKARSNDGFYLATIKEQLLCCLEGIQKSQLKNIVIAYEPVWALSSTENRHDATSHDFEEIKIYIRKVLTDAFTPATAAQVRVMYGGSAHKDNALGFLNAGAAGLLPGKASLEPKNFGAVARIASTIK